MKGRTITYVQPGWNGFQYAIAVTWKKTRGGIEGVWSVQSTYGGNSVKNIASDVRETLGEGYADAYKVHRAWWQRFWDKSAVSLPDSVLEKQWYLEQYKFGSAARADMPPITLQAVWTADNGKLPPWKGDFHHDLNTQLSYWPAYGANHLDEEIGFTNWLWSHRDAFRRYTEGFFGRGGLNVPG
ncbi:MAG: glycosyl hydrolase family 95 catalytic domain-containing protein [Alistipes indistinctus]